MCTDDVGRWFGCVFCRCSVPPRVVFYQSAEATSQYIQYKYGPEAGQAAEESVPVAKDMLDGECGPPSVTAPSRQTMSGSGFFRQDCI